MAVAAHALVTLATAKSELSLELGSLDAVTEGLINAASTWAEHICHRPLKTRAVSTALRGPNGRELYVRTTPIATASAVTITIDAVAQTVWRTSGDGDPENFDVIVGPTDEMAVLTPDHFYRANGWAPGSDSNPYNVVLAFTGGLATIPDTLQRAVLLLIQKLSRDRVHQLGSDVMTVQGSGAPGAMAWRGQPVPLEALKLLEPYMLVGI